MPERTQQADESLRQAARLAADRAAATERAALSTDAATEVLQPASDTASLTDFKNALQCTKSRDTQKAVVQVMN